ncbi:flagellar assembly factor FliW [Clostridium acetireducens DSM 10703]|uniref:Flagellar assembly factor FliW n=1 Tax=Clostridium acetireducens DSM 10703 TaxID=1121290 RepID=A0A1E8EZG6_9CLOT|nr:flagellar assembly protein FliW [Clostridium acetireducens]OFI06508.1 flagellar assembly factor FliW [Clostridium acetireducens DSM 10703]
MKLNTKYHGIIEYSEKEIINFKKGLPGFENLKKFILFTVEENEIFSILHSIEDSQVGIVVMSPFIVCKDYQFKLEKQQIKELNIKSEKDVIALVTVTLSSNIKNITANLRAPIVVNIKDKIGEQIIIEKEDYKIKYPIFQEE